MTAPIVIFAYDRPYHLMRLIESLLTNSLACDSNLIIFLDFPRDSSRKKNVALVDAYIQDIVGFKSIEVVRRTHNFGLAKSIIDGVSEVLNRYESIIVLEDDLVVSPFFLDYMNSALVKYENSEKVISIHGYVYPCKAVLPETFFIRGADCWGWATWRRGWELFNPDGEFLLGELKRRKLEKKFNFDANYDFIGMLEGQILGKNDSWAIRWNASAFLNDKLTLYPGKSLVVNIGHDGTGTHNGNTNFFDVMLSSTPILVGDIPILESRVGYRSFCRYFGSQTNFYSEFMGRIMKAYLKYVSRAK